MSAQKFRTRILAGQTKNVTGIEVPPHVIDALGAGQRPRLKVRLNGYEYISTVGKMDGKFMISLSAQHREAAGLKGDDEVDVTLELAEAPTPAIVPDDVASALRSAGLEASFESAAPSRRKEWLRQIEEAKTPETRARRIAKIVDALRG
ncbi:YdeI/OmpD-associated family protein [Sandaracinobacteroides saxicola]|uniref:DUF1905 domain-containing protein n=1 Tax=Sandaracinobacteroides saxicola TaxID=2759707 RepID=A0A7G5IIN3_9SPHN|nr:YdeI/OmpD-associated family protein [Sandaracinobacteroides saxicola]QMW23225.1 DUF1905 domain-containing protein [Sandaracinobacteroides saxicola]